MYPPDYLSIRGLILSGRLNEAATALVALQNRPKVAAPTWVRLLNLRLSLKSCQISKCHLLEDFPHDGTELRAEALFLNGLVHFHLQDFRSGSDCFQRAAGLYEDCGDHERRLLSLFNEAIGRENLEEEKSLADKIPRFQLIKKLAFESQNHKLLGLASRQLAILYYEDSRRNAAMDAIREALPQLELYAELSDYHSALLTSALIHLDAGHREKAESQLEKVVGIVEERNRFAYDWLRWRLGNADTAPDPSQYSAMCPFFRKVSAATSLPAPKDQAPSGTTSQERHLLALVRQGNFHRDFLCNALWPEISNMNLKLNRLHRLVSRLKSKIDSEIVCRSGIYTLRPRS